MLHAPCCMAAFPFCHTEVVEPQRETRHSCCFEHTTNNNRLSVMFRGRKGGREPRAP